MALRFALHRFRAALAHWGPIEYFALAVVWLVLSSPLYLLGWGFASLLSLPLMLLSIMLITALVQPLVKPRPMPAVQPRPGFPSEIVHPQLGVFALSRHSDKSYENEVPWCEGRARLSLWVEDLDSIGAVQDAAAVLSRTSSDVDASVQALAIKELLDEINAERRADNAETLGPEEFLRAISLELITVHADGAYEFLYGDGELLGGHWIQVYGDLQRGPLEVETPG